jgi:two-component system nitrogen regulation sensor histidine kinase NtrY
MREPRRRRTLVFTLTGAGIAAALGLFLFLGVRNPPEFQTAAGGFFLTGLALLNLLIFVALVFVLFRQLVKGYLEWRRQREGARFRTRLLTAFVVLGLLPALLLFVGAIQIIESAVDQWFRFPVQGISTAGQRLVDHSLDLVRDQTHRKAKAFAWQLDQVPDDLRSSFAEHLFQGGDVDQLWLVARDGKVLLAVPKAEFRSDPYRMRKLFGADGLRGWVDLSAKPMVVSGYRTNGTCAVVVAQTLPSDLFAEAQSIASSNKQYLQVRSQRAAFKVTIVSSFLALTLLVTFVAVWVGSHLSREISVPLQLLLEGTREVSRGNLEHTIDYPAKDEIGIVVESFNRMTKELATSKSDLEQSNQDLREATQAAERGRRYIEVLLETLNIGVVSLGAEGEVRTVNPKARQILGMERAEPIRNLPSLPVWKSVREALGNPVSKPVLNREITVGRTDGQSILSASATTMREHEGTVFGALYILEDITDLSKAQRIAAWQEVARRMAHEIKNPLTPVRLSAQRIRKKFKEKAPDLEEAILQGTTTIEREVEGMLTIVNEFSRFARLPEVHLRPGSLPALVRETLDAYKVAYPKVVFELGVREPFPAVRIDPEQLGRVFKNLVENALEAMKMSGAIQVALQEGEGHVVVTVRDTGPGLAPEARPRLFLPYYSTKRKGSGLGLAIVARIVEEHGGHIKVDESYTGGAGFIITLPVG